MPYFDSMNSHGDEMKQPAKDRNTIDAVIETANQLHKVIQLQNVDEGAPEEQTKMVTAKSVGGEILEEASVDKRKLERAQSAPSHNHPESWNRIRPLQETVRRLKRNLKYMKGLQSEVEKEIEEHLASLKLVDGGAESSGKLHDILLDWVEQNLEDITKKLQDLTKKVPDRQKKKKASLDYQDGDDGGTRLLCLPAIHDKADKLKALAVFRQVKDKYAKLSTKRKICLLSFSVFPENREVNRTMLMYWWIGEGIFLPTGAEDAVKKILEDFTVQKLIEPVENKRKMKPSSYKMSPFVHSSLVLISKDLGLFNMYDEEEKQKINISKLNKVCLVEGSSSKEEARRKIANADQIETVFNVSEGFPDFTSKWFSSMKKLKVLYLGRWERTESQITVDSRRVMKNLSSLKKLRFLSFQGISTLKSLSRSVCKLTELIILDLRDCDYLEQLPKDIHNLKNLVYLDLTGCEGLESMPLGLVSLLKLEVLKGFVVSDGREIACELKSLKDLPKLRKLSVTLDRDDFGLRELKEAIEGFKALENLKVRWGSRIPQSKKQRGKNLKDEQTRIARDIETPLPIQLRKLDLQRFPDSELPEWLWPKNLISLEKLHLGSWTRLKEFSALPEDPTKCSVKVLRLTCLPKLKVEWRELTKLYFPNLEFLEMYECPKVTLTPCDRDGIWRSDVQNSAFASSLEL